MRRRLGLVRAAVADFFRHALRGVLRGNASMLGVAYRRRLYRTTCWIDSAVYIANPARFRAAEGTALYHGCYLLNTNGHVALGINSHLGAYCYVNAHRGSVVIGSDVAIGPGTRIIAYSNHYAPGRKVTEERLTADIVIGRNVFVGANCTILPGSTIEDNVIVAAGAVVKGVLRSNAIYGGVPCRQLREGWFA